VVRFRDFFWLVFVLAFTAPSALRAQLSYPLPTPEFYLCYWADSLITIDGVISPGEWEAAPWTEDFVDIEGPKQYQPYQRTRVKMLWDSTYFYFAAELEEQHLWATLRQRDTVIFYDNDFEIFIDPDGDSHGYYELEMNAFNTVWDLLLPKPYREGGPAIDHWDINGLQSAVAMYGTLNDPSDIDEKWTIEVAIPWDVLEEYAAHSGPPDNQEVWRVNFSRVHYDLDIIEGKYSKQKDSAGNPRPEYNWVWSPQWVVNMHRPETWGFVQFLGQGAIFYTNSGELRRFDLYMALYEVYFAQTEFKKQHGHYASTLEELDLSVYNWEYYSSGFTLEATSHTFTVQARDRDWNLFIDHEGKLTKVRR
jgi:hypothetical protein